MNFIKAFFKIFVFFLTSLVVLPVSSFAIKSSFSPEKEMVSYNFSIPHSLFKESVKDFCFDDNGRLIFSSGQKLGFFNGSSWDFLKLEKSPVLANAPNGSAFFGVGNTILSLQVNSEQSYYLSEYAKISKNSEGVIEQIIRLKRGLLINTGEKLFYLVDSELRRLINEGENIFIHRTDSRLLIQNKSKFTSFSENSGLGEWLNSEIEFSYFEDHPQGYIAFSKSENSFFILSPSFAKLSSWKNVYGRNVFDIITLSPNIYGLISDEEKLFIINAEGEVLDQMEISGLNETSKMKFSPYGRLWISTQAGFRVIDFSPSLQKLKITENQSNITSISYSNGEIYFSDNHTLGQGSDNVLIKTGKIKDLLEYKDGLLYLDSNKLYFLKNGQSSLLSSDELIDYHVDPVSNNILLEGEHQLILIEGKTDGRFDTILEINKRDYGNFSFNDNSIIFHDKNTIFIQNIVTHSLDSLMFEPENGKEKILKIISGLNGYFVGTQESVFFINPDSLQKLNLSDSSTKNVHQKFIASNNKQLLSYWIESKESPGVLRIILADGNQETLTSVPLNILNSRSIKILRKKAGEYLFLFQGEVYSYFLNEEEIKRKIELIPDRLMINGVEIFSGQNFKLSKPYLRGDLNKIPYRDNSFRLHFLSSDFFSSNLSFQYHLMGRDKIWSEWQKGNSLIFERLKSGSYLLKIKIANESSFVSDSFKINFSVLPPFYMSSFAILLYIMIFIGGIFVFYKQYLVRSHELSDASKELVEVEAFNKSEPQTEKTGLETIKTDPKSEKKSKWDKYEMVTVLFSDIQGFTKIAEQMNPERLIDELDQFFYHFDSVVDKYNIEKIKTIGDAYMAAGGIPQKNNTNPIEVVLAALEVQQHMRDVKKTKEDIWDLRIGIHSGPVIAGVVGHKKRSYDIWGDTVNIASRMESSGEGGKVNISGVTYNLIKDFFLCEYRGKIPVKYKGNLDMYFVKGLRPELSINLVGLPNKKFFLKLQLQRLIDLEVYVYEKLEEELPKEMYFNNIDHAKQVYNHSLLLSRAEDLDVEEVLEVRTASLLLPLGYLINYENPEPEAGNIARQILGEFQYSERQVNIISNLILSTKRPCEPQNLLEQVMIDTKLEYLGRADYIQLYKKLFLEENELLEAKEPEKWQQEQIDYLKQFEYYTAGARRLREISFETQVERIEKDKL